MLSEIVPRPPSPRAGRSDWSRNKGCDPVGSAPVIKRSGTSRPITWIRIVRSALEQSNDPGCGIPLRLGSARQHLIYGWKLNGRIGGPATTPKRRTHLAVCEATDATSLLVGSRRTKTFHWKRIPWDARSAQLGQRPAGAWSRLARVQA